MNKMRGRFGLDLEHLVPGSLRIEEDKSFVLELDGFIFKPEQMDFSEPGAVSYSAHPGKIVADFMPRDILGVLDDDEPVSLMGALMDNPSLVFTSAGQSFHGNHSLFGAHLLNQHAPVDGLRWTWSTRGERVLRAITGEAPVEGNQPGTLEPWVFDGTDGLQFKGQSPFPLQILLNEVQNSCSQLLGLWYAQKVPKVSGIEVLVGDRWCTFHMRGQHAPSLARTELMPLELLSVATFARWISLASRIFPFPFILNAPTNVLQLDAQVLGTVVEGLHYRLEGKGSRFPGLSRRAVERAADEARRAGVQALMDEGYSDATEAGRILGETLGHLNDMPYQDRALDLVRPVHMLAPSLFGPDLQGWVQMVKTVRNHQSHQAEVRFDEPLINCYYVMVTSCRWALHLRILIELLPGHDFWPILARSGKFKLALANIDRENLWPGFSALGEFEAQDEAGRSLGASVSGERLKP